MKKCGLWLVGALVSTALVCGCGKKDEPAGAAKSAEPKPAEKKLDCKVFCAREVECFTDILKLLVPDPAKVKLVESDPEAKKTMQDKHQQRCMDKCQDSTKPPLIDTKWLGCLELKQCSEFASCVYPPSSLR